MNYYILPKNDVNLKFNIKFNEKKLEPYICNSLYYYLINNIDFLEYYNKNNYEFNSYEFIYNYFLDN